MENLPLRGKCIGYGCCMQSAYISSIFLNAAFFKVNPPIDFLLPATQRSQAEASILRAVNLFAGSLDLVAPEQMLPLTEEGQLMASMMHIIPGKMFLGSFGAALDSAWADAQPTFRRRGFHRIALHLL